MGGIPPPGPSFYRKRNNMMGLKPGPKPIPAPVKWYNKQERFLRDCKFREEIKVLKDETYHCKYCDQISDIVVSKGKSRTCIYCQYTNQDIYADESEYFYKGLLINLYCGSPDPSKLKQVMKIVKTEHRSPHEYEL